jgi:hypothetical protein
MLPPPDGSAPSPSPYCLIGGPGREYSVAARMFPFRRLKIRYEHRADIHLTFLQFGCALISLRFLG